MAQTNLRPATPTIITLPGVGAVEALRRGCRAALLDFVNGAPFWDRRALGLWLLQQYTPLIRKPFELPAPRRRLSSVLLDARITPIIVEARHTLLACLRLSRRGHAASAGAWRMIRMGALAPCEDDEARGFVPVALPRMKLGDRVVSLWAVDYFSDETDYEASLAICARCQRVEFDALSQARGTCRAHASSFSVRPPRESITRMRPRGGDGSSG